MGNSERPFGQERRLLKSRDTIHTTTLRQDQKNIRVFLDQEKTLFSAFALRKSFQVNINATTVSCVYIAMLIPSSTFLVRE